MLSSPVVATGSQGGPPVFGEYFDAPLPGFSSKTIESWTIKIPVHWLIPRQHGKDSLLPRNLPQRPPQDHPTGLSLVDGTIIDAKISKACTWTSLFFGRCKDALNTDVCRVF